ncbi:MAG: type II toxin-antitoxin system RelE/ParE family toxin [Leptonema sp. (in: Bacteria)]|nr:type II toxin-antitoxin system RelE/ParE family toxin [Leptonema sp. (in: bacteria)]
MEISFAKSELKKQANDYERCKKEMGPRRAELFQKRLNDLMAAETLEDVRHLPGRYHELSGNYKGCWACDLDQPYRLIFKPIEDPIPVDGSGRYIWNNIKGIVISDIHDYH